MTVVEEDEVDCNLDAAAESVVIVVDPPLAAEVAPVLTAVFCAAVEVLRIELIDIIKGGG